MISGNKHTIAAAICAYTYYWYNFMPLARGTAAVGYTTMLGLFWAAGMPVTTPIPTDYQVGPGVGVCKLSPCVKLACLYLEEFWCLVT